jgi:hypothetical protein
MGERIFKEEIQNAAILAYVDDFTQWRIQIYSGYE